METNNKMATGSRYDKLQARYNHLTSKVASGGSLLPDTAYADFIKTHDYQSLPNVVPDSTHLQPTAGGGHTKPRPQSANTIRRKAEASLEESQKRLKAIEDHMWLHRQEERDLKRSEMEVVKQKKQVQRVMKDYESTIARRQTDETKALLGKETELVQYQHKDLHHTQESGRERKQVALAGRQRLNEVTKKYIKADNELSWRYQNLVQALDRKRSEVEQLSQDFESRLRTKEEEQYGLKQELAKLAITLNMEAHKFRQTVTEEGKGKEKGNRKQIQETQNRNEAMRGEESSKVTAGKRYEDHRRGLEQSLKTKQDSLAVRQRQGGRQLLDIRSRLQKNSENKYFTSKEAEHVQLEMVGQRSHNKVELVDARKRSKSVEIQQKRRERNSREMSEWEARFNVRENEVKRRTHEERLKKLSQVVTHYDSHEHDLYSQAKIAESQRKKQTQVVQEMNKELELLKQNNARRLKEAAIQAQKAETELRQKILRENADLAKSVNTREERLRNLSHHRQRAKEDRRLFREEKKEYDRRTRIENRTALQTV